MKTAIEAKETIPLIADIHFDYKLAIEAKETKVFLIFISNSFIWVFFIYYHSRSVAFNGCKFTIVS